MNCLCLCPVARCVLWRLRFNDISIVCFNSSELVGNGLVLPAGPLRERITNILNYDLAFLNGEKNNKSFEKTLKRLNPNLKIFRAKYSPRNLESFKFKNNFLVFSGIGNPLEFQQTLKKYNFKIKKIMTFPDHYNCLLYTSPSPRDLSTSRMPSSA